MTTTQEELFGEAGICGVQSATKCTRGRPNERCVCMLPKEKERKHTAGHISGHICGKCHRPIVPVPTTAAELDCPTAPLPPTRKNAGDTARAAALKLEQTAGTWRRRVLFLAERQGHWGVTGSEAIQDLGAEDNEYTVRQRLTELAGERFGHMLVKTAWRRPNKRGNDEAVYVVRSQYVADLHDDQKNLVRLLELETCSPTIPRPQTAAR